MLRLTVRLTQEAVMCNAGASPSALKFSLVAGSGSDSGSTEYTTFILFFLFRFYSPISSYFQCKGSHGCWPILTFFFFLHIYFYNTSISRGRHGHCHRLLRLTPLPPILLLISTSTNESLRAFYPPNVTLCIHGNGPRGAPFPYDSVVIA